MNSKLTRVICLVILMVVVLLIGATPVTAHSMGDADSCPLPSIQEKAPLPPCCITPVCPLAYSNTANLPPVPDQLTLSKLVQTVRLNANLLPDSSYQKAPCQQDTSQSILRPPGADCPCRNSLQSEEPPQV